MAVSSSTRGVESGAAPEIESGVRDASATGTSEREAVMKKWLCGLIVVASAQVANADDCEDVARKNELAATRARLRENEERFNSRSSVEEQLLRQERERLTDYARAVKTMEESLANVIGPMCKTPPPG